MKLDSTGKRIKYARFLSEKTQKEVMAELGKVHVNSLLSRWEKGTGQISAYDIGRLAKIFGCNAGWLAFNEGNAPEPGGKRC